MRFIVLLAATLAASSASARDIEISSSVYREKVAGGTRNVEPVEHVTRGDRIVTILSWQAPPAAARYTATSAIPPGLRLEAASYPGLEVSTDGGHSWRLLTDADAVPPGTTHLRWPVGTQGRLSYRAVVR